MSKLLNEPACKALTLTGRRAFTGASAACGPPNSRKAVISCPSSAGSQGQCGTGSTGLGIVSILLPATQSTYANCNDVLNAYGASTLVGVSGIYISNTASSTDTVNCSSGTCQLTTPGCYSGWDSAASAASGTANLPLGNQYLACTYIDTSPLILTPITAGGNAWAVGFASVTIGGNLNFNSGWVDAY